MKLWGLAFLALWAVAAALSCADVRRVFGTPDGGFGGIGGSDGGGGSAGDGVPGPSTSDKVDLLLVIDNSRSMADKQEVLVQSVSPLIDGLLFKGVTDMHVGVLTSSLGGLGSDACGGLTDPMENDGGRLIARDKAGGVVPTYDDLGFLAWDPHQGLSPPGEDDRQALNDATAALVVGAGDLGCGFESQLESFYRFLIDPSPYEGIVVRDGSAVLVGTDDALLQERAAFLRRDSLLIIVVLSDENDCSTRAGGQFFFSRQIYQPGTNMPYHMPAARSACATDPADPCCRSCGQTPASGCPDDTDQCQGALSALDDNINVRCFDQKRRFGIDFLYPIDRYDTGLSAAQVTDHSGNVVGNPLYSGQRGSELVIFATIVGAPWQLTSRNGDPADGSHVGSELDASDWRELIGDPVSYTPADDAHMIESSDQRPGLPGPGSPSDDPIHGHEFSIPEQNDLQYACIFPLGVPRNCTLLETCDCFDAQNDNPICEGTLQVAAKSYPGIRELDLVRALGHRGVLGSICPAQQADPAELDYGYRPTFETLLELAEERLE